MAGDMRLKYVLEITNEYHIKSRQYIGFGPNDKTDLHLITNEQLARTLAFWSKEYASPPREIELKSQVRSVMVNNARNSTYEYIKTKSQPIHDSIINRVCDLLK